MDDSSSFYVGYLPVPRPLIRFLWLALPLLVGAAWMVALLAAGSQPSPGNGIWHDADVQHYRGRVVLWPYPILLPTDHPERGYLLVESGKHGAQRDWPALVGHEVEATGRPLERDKALMIELDPGEAGLSVVASAPQGTLPAATGEEIRTLRGEIVDSKCFLGAMKRGHGKTHKACATLCIKGGIPSLFVSKTRDGYDYWLICGADGKPLPESLWPLIADPLEIKGRIESMGGVRRILVAPTDIRPL